MHPAREQLSTFLRDWGAEARVVLLLTLGLVLTRVARRITRRAAERIRLREGGTLVAARRQRTATLLSFALSAARLVIWISVLLTILAELDVNLAPVLTGAGVVGAALVFGAQNVLKDYIAGFFILLENQYTLGDFVKIGTYSGTVEEITMRITVLRGSDGAMQAIPNGTIQGVVNQTSNWARVIVDVALPHAAAVDDALEALREVGRGMHADTDWQKRLLDAPEVPGVVAMTDTLTTVRAQVRVKPQDQWTVRSELLLRIKRALAARDVPAFRVEEPKPGAAP